MRRAILNEQWLNGYVVNSNLPIGAPMAWLSEVPPVGFLAFDGSEYNQEDFPELYEVVKNIPSFHSDTEGKFKIPNLKGRVLQGADTVIGELIEAGLPNITGVSGEITRAGFVSTGIEGAFEPIGENANIWAQQADLGEKRIRTLGFNASKGETKTDGTLKTDTDKKVYGNSDTVQMDAFTVYWVIKATNYVSLEKNAIDDTKTTRANAWSAEQVNNELETKQDILVAEGDNQNIKTVNGVSILGSGNIPTSPTVKALDWNNVRGDTLANNIKNALTENGWYFATGSIYHSAQSATGLESIYKIYKNGGTLNVYIHSSSGVATTFLSSSFTCSIHALVFKYANP